jgi:hypothetical protein
MQERDTGFLEMLLTTPVEAGAILRSKRLALRRHFLLPVIATLTAHVYFIGREYLGTGSITAGWIAFASMGMLFADFFSLSWLGLWEGLLARNTADAFKRTLFLGLLAPWLPFFGVTGLLWAIFASHFKPEPSLLLACGYFSAGVFAAAAGAWGMGQAHFQLRRKIALG